MTDPDRGQEHGIPVLMELGRRFQEAERRPARRHRRPAVLLATAGATLAICAAVAGATGLFSTGAPIPPPPAGDVPRDQTPLPTTATVEPVTSPAPDGGLPWGIRVSKNGSGEPCFAIGRVQDGKLGVVRGRQFHELPLTGPGTCGPAPTPLRYEITQGWGAGTNGGLTTVAGLVAPDVRSVTVEGPDGARTLEISPHGAFVTVYQGVLSPHEVPVTVTLHDGSTQRYSAPGVPG
jgi:hypothetical protein